MVPFFRTFDRVMERVSKVSASVAANLVVPWVLIFVLYVMFRDFFHFSFAFVEEYTHYWMVVVVCLSTAYALRTGVHIRITTVVARLPKQSRNIVDVVAILICLVVSCIFVRYGVDELLFGIREGSRYDAGTEALLWPVYLWIPIGYGLLSLELLVRLCRAIAAVIGKDLDKIPNKSGS